MSVTRIQYQVDFQTNKAISDVQKLESNAKNLSAELKELGRRNKANAIEFDNLTAKIDQNNTALNVAREKAGIAGLSIKELKSYLTSLRKELSTLNPAAENYAKTQVDLTGKINKVNSAIKTRMGVAKESKSIFESLFSGNISAALAGGGIVLVLTQLFNLFQKFAPARAEFEKTRGALAALTGLELQGKELDYLTEGAIRLGKEFKTTATEILNAIQVVGSIKAELLEQKDALLGVTADVITLSKASNGVLSIKDSAEAVTGSLNQFGEEASQSTRYINVLAAGAKAGSSEIMDTAGAFKVAGAVLRANNISFEESNALVQALAGKMIKGSEAGTALRNIFSKLLTGADELNPAIHGTQEVLEKLSKKSPAEIMKLFGQESVVAAMELIKARNQIKGLTKDITDTNEATEQYQKITQNLSGDLDELASASSRFWFNLQEQSSGWLRNMTQGLSTVINSFADMAKYSTLFGGAGFVQKAVDERNEKKRAEDLELKKNVRLDVRQSANDIIDLQKGTANQKAVSANAKVLQQAREQFQNANKEFQAAVNSGADLAIKNQLAKDRYRLSLKIKYAKEEGERLAKLEKDNHELIQSIKDGQARADADKLDKESEKRLKQLQQEIDLRAEIAYKADIVLASEENKKVIAAEYQAEQNITKAKREIQNAFLKKQTIVQIEKDLAAEVIKIRAEFQQKREEQIQNELAKSIELAQNVKSIELQTRLNEAEKTGSGLDVFNAKNSIFFNDEFTDLGKAEAEFGKTKSKYKGNTEALKILEENYQQEKNIITAKYVAARDALLAEYAEKEKNRSKQANLEKLKLDVEADKIVGRNPLQSQIALLNAEMATELSVKDLTEQEKTNIVRKYALQRRQIELESFKATAQQAVSLFGQAFQGISDAKLQGLQNEQTREDDYFQKQLKQLEERKTSEEQYQADKSALEEAHDKKSREIKKKQAELEKKQKIANALMNTFSAVVAALPNVALSIIVGAMGLQNVAQIASTEIPQYESGGFTSDPRKYTKNKPSSSARLAWVNEAGPEFILNNTAVNSPYFPAMLGIFEKMNAGQPVFADLSPLLALPQIQGYEAGGLTAANSNPGNPATNPATPAGMWEIIERNTQALNRVSELLAQPLKSITKIGPKEYQQLQELGDYMNAIKNDSSAL